jgi:hypothetical protein
VNPTTTWKEPIPDDEDARFLGYAERIRDAQRKLAAGKEPARALHAKGNLGAVGTFTVLPDLPPHARAGVFAEPSTYKAYVRFSNGGGRRQHDRVGDVRGIAVKLLGVPGKKLIAGMEDAQTQDFLLIRSRTMPFRDVREFVEVVTAAASSPLVALPKILWALGLGRGLGLLSELSRGLSVPMRSLAATTYYSPAPIRVGDYAARMQLVPASPPEEPLPKGGADYLGEELERRLEKDEVVYDFQLQFYVDDERTPIDAPTRAWSDDDAKPLTVARLTLGKLEANADRARRVREVIEGLSFDPFHALPAHKPIGELMRARNHAYRLSTMERKAKPEPDGTELA